MEKTISEVDKADIPKGHVLVARRSGRRGEDGGAAERKREHKSSRRAEVSCLRKRSLSSDTSHFYLRGDKDAILLCKGDLRNQHIVRYYCLFNKLHMVMYRLCCSFNYLCDI